MFSLSLFVCFLQKRKTYKKFIYKQKETRQYASFIYSHFFSVVLFFKWCIADKEEHTFVSLYQLLLCAKPKFIYTVGSQKIAKQMTLYHNLS